MVDDVLNAAKIEAGRVTAQRKPFDLTKLIQDTVRVVQPQASLKNLEVSTEQGAETPRWFIGDPHLIQQILLNLVSNAVKFTEQGSVIVRTKQKVPEGASSSPLSVRIEVQDTGIGIAEEKLGTIFEAFAQADDSITRVYGGTGLGTTIARQLTKLMGGAIGVESTPGAGSLFWVELPLGPCAPSDAEEGSRISAPTPPPNARPWQRKPGSGANRWRRPR